MLGTSFSSRVWVGVILGSLATLATTPAFSQSAENQNAVAAGARNDRFGVKYTSDFDWSARPADDLSSPGPKSVNLASCPLGVIANEPEYWIYIAGVGTAEAVKVTGGTCAGDRASGSLQFVTTSPHGAGYSVGSASSGLQEASIAARAGLPNSKLRAESGRVVVQPGTVLSLRARVSIRASYQTVDFSGATFDCFMADTCIFVGDPAKSTLFKDITLVHPTGRPVLAGGTKPMIEVNAQKTRIFNVSGRSAPSDATFGSYVQVDDDQAFLLDGLDATLPRIRCDAKFCGSFVTAPGPFNTWSAVGWLKHLGISPGCHGNGVDWQSGNTLRISDSVIQGFAQFGVRTGHPKGGYGGTELDNVYMEEGRNCGIGQNGAAGVIAQGGILTIRSDRNPQGQSPQFQDLGSTYYHYFVILSHETLGDSMPLAAGWAKTDGKTPIEVTWPKISGITGAGRYKVLRMVWDGKSEKPVPSGTGGWLVGSVNPTSCGDTRCKFTDSHTAAQAVTTVNTLGGGTVYFPALDFWPGNIVLSSGSDTQNLSAPAKLFMDDGPAEGIVSVARYAEGPVVFAQSCQWGDFGKGPNVPPPQQCGDPGPGARAIRRGLILQSKASSDGGRFTNYKGRVNFLTTGTTPSPLITWEDSTPDKTLADRFYRPRAEVADSDSGMYATGIQYTRANLGIRDYVGALPDKTNWKESLTAKEKTFAVPVAINPGNTLTLGSGSPLSQIKLYTATAPNVTVPAQSCVDVPAKANGLTPADLLTGITPPAALGNLSLNGYASASDTVTLHFCNAGASGVATPPGKYSFLAVR
jgi:hypothetical protein